MSQKTTKSLRRVSLLLGVGAVASTQVCEAQAGDKETRLLLIPRLSFNFVPRKASYATTSGKYEFSADAQQKYSIIYPDGNPRDVNPAPLRLGVDVGFKRVNLTKHQAWSLLVGTDYGTEFYPSKSTYSASYKGSTVSGWHELFSYWQLNGAVTYYWLDSAKPDRGGFIRLGVGRPYNLVHLKYADKTFVDSYPASYVESGQGDLVTLKNYRENNLSIIPEIGLVDKWVEVSLSTSLPLQSSFTEVHTLYQNNKVVGQNEITYRLGGVFLNVRGVINVVRHVRKPRPEPAPAPPRVSKPIVIVGQKLVLDNVHFAKNNAKLLSISYLALDDLATQMQEQPSLRIRLEGHTDIIGNAARHQKLSEKRVAVIKKYLVKKGISEKRIEAIGRGDTQPVNRDCKFPKGCPENRRVEVVGIAS